MRERLSLTETDGGCSGGRDRIYYTNIQPDKNSGGEIYTPNTDPKILHTQRNRRSVKNATPTCMHLCS